MCMYTCTNTCDIHIGREGERETAVAVSEQADRPNLITARCLSCLAVIAANQHASIILVTLACSSRTGGNLYSCMFIMYAYQIYGKQRGTH